MPQRKIMIIAGEASGDAHGAKLVQSLRYQDRDLEFFGMGSDHLRASGMEILVDSKNLGVVGFIEVLKIIKKIRQAFKVIKEALTTRKPDLLILIDYPGFNLRMARFAKKHNVKVLYYISPQLWAWHKSRVKIIKKYVDTMAVILPFEVDFYRQHKVNAQYVGHPLISDLDNIPSRQHARTTLHLGDATPVIAVCPGSRRSELEHLIPILSETIVQLKIEYPDSKIIVPIAPTLTLKDYEPLGPSAHLIEGDFYTTIAAADVAVAASGTATLQIALTTTPMVIIYRGNNLSYQIAKRLVNIPSIGLCNLVADKKIVRELIQNEVTPEAICQEIFTILEDKSYHDSMIQNLTDVAEKLSRPRDGASIGQLALALLPE